MTYTPVPVPSESFTTIQDLIWPDHDLSTEYDLYFRRGPQVWYSDDAPGLTLHAGGSAAFNTYFNLFNIGKWQKHCALEDLHLALLGHGTVEVRVFLVLPDRSWERLVNRVIPLTEGEAARVDLSHFQTIGGRGILYFELAAVTDARLDQAQWQTRQAPQRKPDLALSITTFRREAAVRHSVARFEEFVATSPLREHLHLIVVDNGQSAGIMASDHVTPVLNENLGGSGGFARGLLEARARGASHCLFMDDDASVHMQSVERSWQFLAYATDPSTAVAGAMGFAQHRWQLWENGALFDLVCHARFGGLDLRDAHQVYHMEYESTATPPHNFYGGWWYFAFPLDHADYMPFPFFVRGDDISFGIINPFNTVTLPGVMSFQEEDFANKESGQTFYLDLRSHLGIHLGLPTMDIGRKGMLRIAAFFFLRSLLTCHYESLTALNIAMRDAIEGPDFFEKNVDMADRRKLLGQIPDAEKWRPIPTTADASGGRALPRDRFRLPMHRRWLRGLMKITLNGHLLPFFPLFGNHITLPSSRRGDRRAHWGASQVTYISADGEKAYTVRHNKRKAWRESWGMAKSTLVLLRDYEAIRDRWQKGYIRLTRESYWKKTLKLEEDTAPPSP